MKVGLRGWVVGMAIWKVAARRETETSVATVRREEVVRSNSSFCFLFPHSYTIRGFIEAYRMICVPWLSHLEPLLARLVSYYIRCITYLDGTSHPIELTSKP